jgi:hypothetical protein
MEAEVLFQEPYNSALQILLRQGPDDSTAYIDSIAQYASWHRPCGSQRE